MPANGHYVIYALATGDRREGMTAFLEKRPAIFRGQ